MSKIRDAVRDPKTQVHALETLAKYFRLYGGPNAGEAEKNLIRGAADAVHRGIDDPDPTTSHNAC